MARWRPRTRVSNLALTRDGNTMKATWKLPADLTKGDWEAQWIDVKFWLDRAGVRLVSTDVWKNNTGSERPLSFTAADRFWCKGLDRGGAGRTTSLNKAYDRNRFHPISPGKYLKSIKVGVHPGTHMQPEGRNRGPEAWATYSIGLPRAPKVTQTYDQETATITFTIETDAGKDNYERWDTMYRLTLRRQDGKTVVLRNWTSNRSTKFTVSWDISGYITDLQAGKYVEVHCYAYARGMAGDNPAQAKAVHSARSIVFPLAGTVGKPTCDRKAPNGRIKVPVSSDGWAKSLQLQRRNGETGSWTDVPGAVDNQNAKALYDSYGGADPQPGEYVYYRTKATRDGYTSYSSPVRADCIFTAKPVPTCSASAGIVKTAPSADGLSCAVSMGFTDSTANDGCELSWSDDPNAWNSTEGPSVQTFTGQDASRVSTKYARSRTVTLSGLTPGVTYYCRCRRYREVDGQTLYSGYSGTASFKTESAEDDKCALVSAQIEPSGTSAMLVIGIDEDSANTGTEVSWSTDEHAWESNQQPDSINADWPVDSPKKSADWGKTQTVYIRGLELGTTYYIKCRRYLTAGGSTTYGPWSKTASFSTPSQKTNADVRCGLVSVLPGEDGRSALVVVGWGGDRTECEVSWSDSPDAWESSEQPDSFSFGWSDRESRSEDWPSTGTAYIHGLEEGVTYYVRARSHHAATDAWSDYSEAMAVTPVSAPSAVVLTAPSAVARGDAIELWWSVESELEQTEWHVHDSGHPYSALAEGTGSLCRAVIPAERYGDADSIELFVEAGCGGGLTRSNMASVGIADRPTCEAYMAPVLTAQPAVFEVYTDSGSRLLATCFSMGCTLEAPDGPRDQLEGDSVWTSAIAPSWREGTWGETDLFASLEADESDARAAYGSALSAFEAVPEYQAMQDAKAALDLLDPEDEGYAEAFQAYQAAREAAYATPEGLAYENAEAALSAATAALEAHPSDGSVHICEVAMPVSDLYDGGSYRMEFKAVESVAGLSSEAASVPFSVEWAHQAVAPSATVTPHKDERRAAIAFSAEGGSGDVIDLYRKTPTGFELVLQGLPLDAEVTDWYAPFGESAYRAALRTPDGDIAWDEFPYELDVRLLRLDWDGESAEFPWNLELRERETKDFEARTHLDGSVNGYWNRATVMDGSYSTDIVKFDDAELLEKARRMGSYPGPVWVRDSHGKAMQCNVTLEDVGISYSSGAVGLSFGFTKVKTTSEFHPTGKEDRDG